MTKTRRTTRRSVAAVTLVGLVATAAVAMVAWRAAAAVEEDARTAERETHARSLYQFLDTRSSELKVSALKALAGTNPDVLRAEVADDTNTVGILIADLQGLDLDADGAARADAVESAFARYTASIATYVDAADAERRSERPTVRDVQAANDAIDAVLSAAVTDSGTDARSASSDLNDTAEGLRFLVLVVAALGLALLLVVALVLGRPGAAEAPEGSEE